MSSLKNFSVEEAQEIVQQIKPIVREIKGKAREYSKSLMEATQLVHKFRENPRDTEGVLDRVIKARGELKDLFRKLEGFGVILRDIDAGIVDFPTEMGGEEGYFCIRTFEESEIKWWHRKDEVCQMRRPIKKE